MHNSFRITFCLVIAFSGLIASKRIGVTEAQIKERLNKYWDTVKAFTGIPVQPNERSALEAKYTDGTKSSKYPAVTLKEVAQVLISLEKATLGNGESCDVTNQYILEKLHDSGRHNPTFQETVDHYNSLDDAGSGKFCNFFAFLRCRHEPSRPARAHDCLCPAHMIWQGNTCVFRKNHKCDDISAMNEADKALLPVYDFKDQEFTQNIPANCEGRSTCRIGGSNMCDEDDDSDYLASVLELSNFIRRHLNIHDDNPSVTHDSGKIEALRTALKDITHSRRHAFRRALSLEMHMESRLLDVFPPGSSCDPEAERPLHDILINYNGYDGPDSWHANEDIELDTIRFEFQKSVFKKKIKVCNPFNLLQCSRSSRRCECKGNLIEDHSTHHRCAIAPSFRCNDARSATMKLFEIKDHMKDGGWALTYYNFEKALCSGSLLPQYQKCQPFGTVGSFCYDHFSGDGSLPEIRAELYKTRLEFERLFSIDVDDECEKYHQKLLFDLTDSFHRDHTKSYKHAKEAIQKIINLNPRLCRIRQHAMCSDEGRCVCIPPMIPKEGRCGVPIHWKCNSVHMSELHVKLDKLKLPLRNQGDPIQEMNADSQYNLFCGLEDAKCKADYCVCSDPRKYGADCDKDTHHQLNYISIENVPISLRNPKGIQLLEELHDTLNALNANRLGYDEPCESTTNQEMTSIMDFLSKVREDCNCYWHHDPSDVGSKGNWKCYSVACESDTEGVFAESKFVSLLQDAKKLLDKSPKLCSQNHVLRCVKGKCGCADDYFYEEALCRVDLGGRCNVFKLQSEGGHDQLTTCRKGLVCAQRGHSVNSAKTRCVSKHFKSCEDCTKEEVVSKTKEWMRAELKSQKSKLESSSLQNIPPLRPCRESDATKVKSIVPKFGPLLEMTQASSSDVDTSRGHVRQLEILLNSAKALLDWKPRLCKTPFVCSETTHKCMNATRKPPKNPSFASGHFHQISVFKLNILSFSFVVLVLQ